MATEQQRLTSVERENLVAYLDGELNPDESQRLSTKLTQSLSGRREVEDLKRTWELLDALPRPNAPEDFTARTLSEIQAEASPDERLARVAGRSLRVASRVLVGVLLAGASLAGAYAATRWLWPDPSARLIRDLSLAEHLDEYREVGTFEFLKELDEMPEPE